MHHLSLNCPPRNRVAAAPDTKDTRRDLMVEYRSGTSKSSSVAAQPTLLAPDDDETRGSEVQSGGLHAGDAHGSVSPKKVDAAETFSVSCAGAVPTESATQATACSPPVLSNQLPAVGTSDGLLHPIIGQASPLSEETIRALKTVILTLLSVQLKHWTCHHTFRDSIYQHM
jgi:hypothetical protein